METVFDMINKVGGYNFETERVGFIGDTLVQEYLNTKTGQYIWAGMDNNHTLVVAEEQAVEGIRRRR